MTSPSSDPESSSEPAIQEPVVARAGRYYRNTRYIITLLLIGFGVAFAVDGFVRWPAANQQYETLDHQRQEALDRGDKQRADQLLQQQNNYAHHTDLDILLQKILCFVLPPVGLIVLFRSLRNSRGEYRLEGQTLHIPGHPPVPFENITEIDRRLWDKKGIAYISYDLGNGEQGTLRLDDFVYDRPPTDEIFKRIEDYATPHTEKSENSKAQEETHG